MPFPPPPPPSLSCFLARVGGARLLLRCASARRCARAPVLIARMLHWASGVPLSFVRRLAAFGARDAANGQQARSGRGASDRELRRRRPRRTRARLAHVTPPASRACWSDLRLRITWRARICARFAGANAKRAGAQWTQPADGRVFTASVRQALYGCHGGGDCFPRRALRRDMQPTLLPGWDPRCLMHRCLMRRGAYSLARASALSLRAAFSVRSVGAHPPAPPSSPLLPAAVHGRVLACGRLRAGGAGMAWGVCVHVCV